ncbi:hypothetical protein SASPL_109330 [Salvia splendens]|uniref:HMA domain-containing protein n=1 Tax=Salvia splendens TaxID=180675 RepID=A0A8X9A684_SALSN|nr:hypothetical protein SASPL_109330 [Salvia splendens]
MSNQYDNWERLRRQHDREIALCPSTNSSPFSSRSSSFNSEFYYQLHSAIIKHSNNPNFPFSSATMASNSLVKIVVRVSMNDKKSLCKALKITTGISGIESVALAGAEKDQVVVVGDSIDAVELLQRLRKNVGYADA